MFRTILLVVGFLCTATVQAQRITPEEYIQTYKDVAIEQMKRLGVPASIILAQGILETECGNSDLVKRSNNHFGIKCKSTWTGPSVTHTDDAPDECFRKYASAEESYRDHSDYLYNTPRYAFLFQLSSTDYKGWAYGLKKAGYATNPRYPQILISNIEKYNLQQFNFETGAPDNLAQSSTVAVAGVKEEAAKEGTEAVTTPGENKDKNVFKKLFSGKSNTANQHFNRLEAVMAFSGKSLLAIATENDIPLAKLLEYNDLEHDGLVKEDQWIYLEKKHKEGNRDFYTAIKNETLYEISQVNGVQLEMLAAYNQLGRNSTIAKGTRVNLRPGLPVAVAMSPDVQEPITAVLTGTTVHVVQPKEGLYGISKKYNVSVQELMDWNKLSSDQLQPGQKLVIAK